MPGPNALPFLHEQRTSSRNLVFALITFLADDGDMSIVANDPAVLPRYDLLFTAPGSERVTSLDFVAVLDQNAPATLDLVLELVDRGIYHDDGAPVS